MTREEAIKWLNYHINITDYEETDELYIALKMAIEALEQEPKTGHWILADDQNEEDVENDNYRFICSECQCSDIHAKGTIVPYCWKCGAKMVEPPESEE